MSKPSFCADKYNIVSLDMNSGIWQLGSGFKELPQDCLLGQELPQELPNWGIGKKAQSSISYLQYTVCASKKMS